MKCSECHVETLPDFLVDCSDIAPLAGLCCLACERELLADRRERAMEESWNRMRFIEEAEQWA